MKTRKWLWVEVIVCEIFWSELERTWNLQGWSTRKPYSLGVLFFGLGVFKGCYTLSLNHTCSNLRFFQNVQDKSRDFSGVFTKEFPQPPCLFFFSGVDHWQTDRYPAHCSSLELLPEPPQNKICYRLHPKIIRLSSVSQ